MSGFSGYLIKSTAIAVKLNTFQFEPVQNALFAFQSEINFPNFKLAWYSNSKFKNDKGLVKNHEAAFGFDGINLNEDTSSRNWLNVKMLENLDADSLQKLVRYTKGSFQTFFYNEHAQQLILHTDHTGSKPFFYFENEEIFIFSSSIFFVKEVMDFLGFESSLDTVSAYQFLSFGYMIGNHTLVQQIRKLEPGHGLVVSLDKQKEITQYFKYDNQSKIDQVTEDVLTHLDDLFIKSIQLEYNKDLQYGFKHLSHLSGGLDSRLNVMLANELGFKNQTNLTFGQDQSSDELIARTISNDLGHLHLIVMLGNGNYLMQSQLPLILNNCSVYYFGAAQTLLANQNLNFEQFGLTHNGILAESSKGGYLKNAYHEPVQIGRWGVSSKLLYRIQPEMDELIKKTNDNDELFALYQRGFNAIHNGTWMTEPFSSSVYTYMEPDFANFAFSIDPKHRVNGDLTIHWMQLKHPKVNLYKWKYNALPTTNKTKLLAARIQNRLMLMSGKKDGVAVPVAFWFSHNSNLKAMLLEEFPMSCIENIQLSSDINELKKNGTLFEKLLVFNFFSAFKILFKPNK